jgi:hypothetical protein
MYNVICNWLVNFTMSLVFRSERYFSKEGGAVVASFDVGVAVV